jgi:hypothetical protein
MKWRVGIILGSLLALGSCGSGETDPDEDLLDAGEVVRSTERRYDLPLDDVWAAAEEAVREDVAIERRRRSDRRGILIGRTIDGRRMKVVMRALPERGADVAVTVEPGSRDLVEMVQGRIGEKLSLRKARAELFGERTVEGAHAADLRRCLDAAERACQALDLEILHKHLGDSGGRLEARDPSGRKVRFALQPVDGRERETGAVLTADDGESELLRQVEREFTRQLFPVAD